MKILESSGLKTPISCTFVKNDIDSFFFLTYVDILQCHDDKSEDSPKNLIFMKPLNMHILFI